MDNSEQVNEGASTQITDGSQGHEGESTQIADGSQGHEGESSQIIDGSPGHESKSNQIAEGSQLQEGESTNKEEEGSQGNNDQSTHITEGSKEEREEAMAYLNFRRKFKEEKDKYGTWYIISKDWITQWKLKINYAAYKYPSRNATIDTSYIGDLPKISNEEIIINPSSYLKLKDDTQILIDPSHQRNLEIANETVWKLFVSKYQGGPEIKFSLTSEDQVLELEFLKINFIIFPLRSEIIEAKEESSIELKEYTTYMKINPTFGNIKERIIKLIIEHNLLGNDYPIDLLTNENIRLWSLQDYTSVSFLKNQFEQNKEELSKLDLILESSDFNINNANMFLESNFDKLFRKDEITFCIERSTPASKFIFEIKEIRMGKCEYNNVYGLMTVCCKCKLVWYCNEICLRRDKTYHERNCPKSLDLDEENIGQSNNSVEGLCGLSNLGNTCFMNTSLQCLSNCFALTDYFINGKYKKDLNEENPLGSKGLIARVYAHFLKNLWHGDSSVFTPHQFKQALGNYLKLFSGYQQHDTQEFLNYLLDVLHEDLNKVIKKPIVSLDDTNQPDNIKSKSHWLAFLKRNQSVLVDIFYGQFKSTLTCPMDECRNISITFDPFLSLSLPLVSKVQVYTISCFFIFHNASLSPLFFQIPFYKETTFMAFRNKLAQMLNIHPWSFLITTLPKQQSIKEFISETKPLHTLMSTEKTKYFLFQIDPSVFYSPLNISIKDLKEASQYEEVDFGANSEEYANSRQKIIYNIYSENYEEDSSNKIDDLSKNYGLSSDIVPSLLQFMDTVSDYIVFPRAILLNKTQSIKDLYFYIYTTFRNVMMCNSKKTIKNHPLDNSPQKESNKNELPSASSLSDFQNIFKDLNDEDSFNEAFDNNDIPFYILYLPRNRSTRKEKIYYLKDNEDTLETYLNKFNNEPDHLSFSVNKIFTLGIVWNRQHSHNSHSLKEYSEPKIPSQQISNKIINIYECFDRFVKEEVLDESNEWYCPKCKEHRRATKKIEIYKIPKYLIIHLKRFNNKTKLDAVVDFPIKDLDIAKYVISDDKDTQFDLVAIANHYGSMGFGHYIAFAKNHKKDQWYEFDDSRVSRKDEDDLVTSSAYVLFYSKKSNSKVDWNEIYSRAFSNYETESDS